MCFSIRGCHLERIMISIRGVQLEVFLEPGHDYAIGIYMVPTKLLC